MEVEQQHTTNAYKTMYIAPSSLIRGAPEVPSSKYYTLRYVLAAALAEGESRVHFPADSDDSEALLRGCRALGAQLAWEDTHHRVLRIQGIGGIPGSNKTTINVGNAGAVLRLLLGVGALIPEVTFVTDHPQSLGKRPNRELLQALQVLGARCEGATEEGYLPITIHGGSLHGGKIAISGTRSSQYLSALLFLAPLLPGDVEITIVDMLKSQPLVRASLEVLHEAGITIEHDDAFHHYFIPGRQRYQPRTYVIPGDYPSAAALLAVCAVANDPASEIRLTRLRQNDEIGTTLLNAFKAMGAELHIAGETVTLHGGQRLHGIELDGDAIIDCIPVLVATACFAMGDSIFSNIESLHYKESDRIDDLCRELRRAGCDVVPQHDAIVVHGHPEGITGGVTVDGHHDHRLLMALTTVALRSQLGLTLTGTEHIAKSYPHYFEELAHLGVSIQTAWGNSPF